MAALRNLRHEIFAQEVATGKSAAQAYLAAGLRADRRSAWRVRHRSDVVRRIEELIQTERE
jgi:phage terminase small subunit